MSKQGRLVVVLGKDSSQVSEALTQWVASNQDPENYYTMVTSAKMPSEQNRFILEPSVDGKLSLKGDPETIKKLFTSDTTEQAKKNLKRVIIHDAEEFLKQHDTYDYLLALRESGYDIIVGAKTGTLLIELLAQAVQIENPSNEGPSKVILVNTNTQQEELRQ